MTFTRRHFLQTSAALAATAALPAQAQAQAGGKLPFRYAYSPISWQTNIEEAIKVDTAVLEAVSPSEGIRQIVRSMGEIVSAEADFMEEAANLRDGEVYINEKEGLDVAKLSTSLKATSDVLVITRAKGQPMSKVDGDGLIVDQLRQSTARAVLVTPAHQYPTGAVLAPPRRRAIIAWARDVDGYVIEDDYDAEYRYDRAPIGAMQGLDPERVAYAGTASKTLAPGFRIGWLILPPDLIAGTLFTVVILLSEIPNTLAKKAAEALDTKAVQRWLIVMSVIGAALLIIRAFEFAPAATLAPFAYLQIVAALLLGLAVFGNFPGPLALSGMALIVATGIVMALRQRMVPPPADD